MENINNETALPKVMPLPAGKAIFVWCNNPETGYCYLKISLDEIVSVVYSESKRQCAVLVCNDIGEKVIDTAVTLEEISAYLPKGQFVHTRWNEFADLTLVDIHTPSTEASRMCYEESLYIRDGECYVRADFRYIQWITLFHNYCDIHVTNHKNPFCSIFTLSKWMQYLPAEHFLRINRSNIVNVHCVDKISSTALYIQGTEFVVPRQNRHVVNEFFHIVQRIKTGL